MKFIMNGTLTLDILDGANVETLDAVDEDNTCIFGATEDELLELRKNYDPYWHYENIPGLEHILDALVGGAFDDNGSGWSHNLC